MGELPGSNRFQGCHPEKQAFTGIFRRKGTRGRRKKSCHNSVTTEFYAGIACKPVERCSVKPLKGQGGACPGIGPLKIQESKAVYGNQLCSAKHENRASMGSVRKREKKDPKAVPENESPITS